jgi:hypothetical protein
MNKIYVMFPKKLGHEMKESFFDFQPITEVKDIYQSCHLR